VAFLKKASDIGRDIGVGRTGALAGHIHIHVIEIGRICGKGDLPDDLAGAVHVLTRIVRLLFH
jgi:hypothetical protein